MLAYRLSQDLYVHAGEPGELSPYPGDNHGIERHRSEILEKLYEWSTVPLTGEKSAR